MSYENTRNLVFAMSTFSARSKFPLALPAKWFLRNMGRPPLEGYKDNLGFTMKLKETKISNN